MPLAALSIHQISTKLPSDRLSNREFSFLIPETNRPEDFTPETADRWIHERTGISTRSVADRSLIGTRKAPIETEFKLTLDSLDDFNITARDWQELDAIVVVKSAPIQYAPSLSQKLVKHFSEKFSAEPREKTGVFTLDLFQPSTGLLAALKTLLHFPFRNAWVIIPEILTPFINLKDPASAILFGDGVAALWLSKDSSKKSLFTVLDATFESLPDTQNVLGFLDTNESAYMKGPELFRKIIPEFKRSSLEILKHHHFEVSDIQYYLPHQANARILERAATSIGFRTEQIITNIRSVGNLASASMVVALDHFLKDQKMEKGDRILMNACGAGLTSGAAILEATQ